MLLVVVAVEEVALLVLQVVLLLVVVVVVVAVGLVGWRGDHRLGAFLAEAARGAVGKTRLRSCTSSVQRLLC